MMERSLKFAAYGLCGGVFLIAWGAQAWSWAVGTTFRLNTTPSMPYGLWSVSRKAPLWLQAGEAIAVCLPVAIGRQARARGYVEGGECPGGTAPLIKTVAALPGDVVTVSALGMAVNGRLLPHSAALAHDSKRRPIRGTAYGSYTVTPGRVWLYAKNDPRSFDSRYYGAVTQTNVIGRAWPVLVIR